MIEAKSPVRGVKALLGPADSHARSLTKAVTWRAIGTADTFVLSYLVTGEPMAAGAIASMETLTKIGLYYLHERVWRAFRWAPNARARSLSKAVSWRFVGSMDTFLISWLITGNPQSAASIASLEVLTKVVLYYIHERVWRTVPWGRLDSPTATQ